jgi:hypothetical protein
LIKHDGVKVLRAVLKMALKVEYFLKYPPGVALHYNGAYIGGGKVIILFFD